MKSQLAKKKQYPKVLVIGQTFNKTDGGGITLSNLFFGWPKERLAAATNNFISDEMDSSVCCNYFQLSYNGKLHPFPLNIFLPRIKEGPVELNSARIEKELKQKKHKPLRFLTVFWALKAVMDFFGVYSFLYRIKITKEFEDWVKEFNPDIIYSPLNTLEMIRLVNDLHNLCKKPVAIHMWDDWPSYINKPGLLYFYWKKTIDREFKRLLTKSTILFSISESMRLEYIVRYKKDFIPFHNPIEVHKWLPFSKNDWEKKEKFTILYAGRIGIGMKNSIVEFASVVNELSKEIKDIVFEIQTNLFFLIDKQIKLSENVRYVKPISYDKLPAKFSSVDLLLLPIDFDAESVNLIKFSFQTKISEYMISGTPVLVYADKSTEVARLAKETGWAYLVSERNREKLKEAIKRLYLDEALRKKLGQKAISLAKEKENAQIVREEFRKHLALEYNRVQFFV